MAGYKRAPKQLVQDERHLRSGRLPYEDQFAVLNCNQLMHFDLIYGRRQILVVIQLIFGGFDPTKPLVQQEYAYPINDQGQVLDFFESEKLTQYVWHNGMTFVYNKIKQMITAELNANPDLIPKRLLLAKHLELAVMAMDHLDKVIDDGNELFDAYINKCRNLIALMEEGLDRDIKKAAVDIWEDKLDLLTEQVKSVAAWRNLLLDLAAKLFSQPNAVFQSRNVLKTLSRIYERLFTAPDRVPVVDFANVALKISDWEFEKLDRDEQGHYIWFDPPKHAVVVLGNFGALATIIREREEGRAPERAEKEWIEQYFEPPNMRFEFNEDHFHFLQALHYELIWARRQILIVIQLIFGDFQHGRHIEQQEFVGPFEADGSEFNLEQREGIDDLQRWYATISFALRRVTNMINNERPANIPRITDDDQRKAKYLELAAEGLRHIVEMTTRAIEKFKSYNDECQDLISGLRRNSRKKLSKQAKLNKFAVSFLNWSEPFEKLIELREWLLKVAVDLMDRPGIVDMNQVHNVLSGIYFTIYLIPDRLPIKEFLDVAHACFGWNWTIEVSQDESGEYTWFQKPVRDVEIRGNFGVLMERRIESGGVQGLQ